MDQVPSWASQCIGYQIFVDSFAGDQAALDRKKHLYQKKIYDRDAYLLNWKEQADDYHYGHGFYGGDLTGVDHHVNQYLSDLGIDLLYLTPVFEAVSNHKYDTVDYFKIDPQFGSMEDFERLVRSCQNHGIRLILDGVFNHTSSLHAWHQQAITGDEHYLNYYKRNKEGFIQHYEAIQTMPLVDHQNKLVQEYFYFGQMNVINYWMQKGAGGWRLDVAERLGKKVIAHIRTSLKEFFPEGLLIGEVVESYGKEWLQDGLLDGCMNYVFRGTTANFLTNKIDAANYLFELNKMWNEYPRNKLYASWNIISTHDTNRMLYDLKGNESLFKLAVVLQFTYPGVPMIYYGDELGMKTGKKEESNRTGMEWDVIKHGKMIQAGVGDPMDWQKTQRFNSFHNFYKHLIWIRQNYSSLNDGLFYPVEVDNHVLAYFRSNQEQSCLIVINRHLDKDIIIKIPAEVELKNDRMNCLYGQNDPAYINDGEIKLYANGQNAYIFCDKLD